MFTQAKEPALLSVGSEARSRSSKRPHLDLDQVILHPR